MFDVELKLQDGRALRLGWNVPEKRAHDIKFDWLFGENACPTVTYARIVPSLLDEECIIINTLEAR